MDFRIGDGLRPQGEVIARVFEGDLPPMTPQEWAEFYESGRADALCIARTTSPNLVSAVGRQQMTKLIVNETTVRVGYIALSTSVIVPAVADLTLPSEKIRQAISVIQSNLTYYQLYSAYYATGDFSSTTITAAALNDTVTTGGNQWADASIVLSKTTAQSATVQWTIFISS